MSKEIREHNKNGKLIYIKDPSGFKIWYKYDENNNEIYFKNSYGFERWQKYDENNNLIHFKNSDGGESWYKYDKNNRKIVITEQEYKEIEFRKKEKEYLSRKKCSRFEIMDI